MKIYYTKRCMGKTQRCILGLAEDPNSVLIVTDSDAGGLIVGNNKGIKNIEGRVFSAQGIRIMEGLSPKHSLIIDNIDVVARIIGVDGLLQLSQKHEIKFATATIKEVNGCSDDTITITI